MADCSDCGTALADNPKRKGARCQPCAARQVGLAKRRARPPAEACSECGKRLALNPRRKGTRCQPCVASSIAQDDSKRAKCRDAMVERFQEPGYVERHSSATAAGIGEAMKRNPAERERRKACGRRMSKDNVGRKRSPEVCARMGKATRERLLAGIPIEYRGEYRRMVKNRGFKAVDARAIILDQVQVDTARYLQSGEMPVHGPGVRKDGTCFSGAAGGQRPGGGA